MKLLVLGAPGAGKGTQSEKLSEIYNIPHISTGDLLRGELKIKSEIGLKVADIIEKGLLVPDEIITDLLKARLESDDCKNGFILDGYPRNLEQVEILEKLTSVDKIISIEVDDEIILERLSGRYNCPTCGKVYNLKSDPPKNNLTCDDDDSKLFQRDDDKEETILDRLKIYNEVTVPIKGYYDKQNKLLSIDGTKKIKEITEIIVKSLGADVNGNNH